MSRWTATAFFRDKLLPSFQEKLKSQKQLDSSIILWLIFAALTLAINFFILALLYGNGTWPDLADGESLRQISLSTVSLTTIFAGAVGIAIAFKRQKTTDQAHELDRNQDNRDRVAALRDRFTKASEQLGHDSATIRIAGAYALAALADDWLQRSADEAAHSAARREVQVCIDLLCAYIRTPRKEPIESDAQNEPRLSPAQAAETEVRTTIVSIIADHLRIHSKKSAPKWSGFTFNFQNAIFDNGVFSFREVVVDGETALKFSGATFTSGFIDFSFAKFNGGDADFSKVHVAGGELSFNVAGFPGGKLYFYGSRFTGGVVDFSSADFTGGEVLFNDVSFEGGTIDFEVARFAGGTVTFNHSKFKGGTVDFSSARFLEGTVNFTGANFIGSTVNFSHATFYERSYFHDTSSFTGGTVTFIGVEGDKLDKVTGPWEGEVPPPVWPPPAAVGEGPVVASEECGGTGGHDPDAAEEGGAG